MDKYWIFSTLTIWLLFIFGNVKCQVQNGPIGAHRVYEKTSFSCAGRSNGYYADIETGCQVYHMCDGLGRQFTYSCPNTTLFQQRMLICDHWYMVNCSRAESDYDANLLIGQRDKPFVPDDENQQRTPRPDLLDRPYAPDYSGESFRNQYKQIPPVPNQIDDSNQDNDFDNPPHNDPIRLNPPPSSTRWRIVQPSQEILPPSIDPIIVGVRRMDEIDDSGNIDLGTSFSSNYNTSADISSEYDKSPVHTVSTTVSPTTTTSTTTQRRTTTFQTRPTKSTESNIIAGKIKVPSKLYEPPFLYPVYNDNYTEADIDTGKFTTSTASPFIIVSTTTRPPPLPLTRPTTSAGRPFSHTFKSTTQIPTTFKISTTQQQSTESLEQAESSSSFRSNYNNYDFSRYVTTTTARPNIIAQTTFAQTQELNNRQQETVQPIIVQPIVVQPIENQEEQQHQQQENPTSDEQYYQQNQQDFKKIAPNNLQPSIQEEETGNDESSILDFNIPTGNKLTLPSPFTNKYQKNSDVPEPPLDLLPPFMKFVEYDIATTQGPPIYYEWKIPSNALEAPKLDPPIGVDGRLPPDYLIPEDGDNVDLTDDQQQIVENSSAQIDEHAVQEQQLQQGSFGQKIKQHQTNDQQLQAEQSETSYSSSQSPSQPANNPFAHNPFLASLATKSQRSVDSETRVSPTPRSISSRTNNDLDNTISTSRRPPTELEIQQLKHDYLVPDFLFPLEEIGRTGYDVTDTFNSFQLKIPKRKIDGKGKHWYGENIKCPECHPSFVKPGTCEPCVRRR